MEMKDGNFGHHPSAGPNNQAGMKPGERYTGPASHPSQGYAPQGHPSQGHPSQGYAPQGHPTQGYAPQGYAPQGHPSQGYGPQGYPPGSYSSPGYPAPGMPAQYGYQQPPPGSYQGHPNYGQYGAPPAQNQATGPGASPAVWMPAPPSNPNCPPGLEYLSQIDQLLVHQQVELLEALIGYETNNKYEIKNSMGQKVYFAAEQNDCCTRNCLGSARYFVITIVDNMGREVIRLSRPCRCSCCCFPCCLQKLQVESPPGTIIGYVKQNWHPCLPKFTIQNEREEDLMRIKGPCVPCSCCSDVNFELTSLDECSVIGKISKQWSGFLKEAFTDADNFGVQFPMDLDVKIKAVVLGALFLIDFMYFEHSEDK